MNILAHGYLSNKDEGLLIGNFIADFVKGDPAAARHGLAPPEIAGIRLHRSIDLFTDTHPAVEAVRELLRPRCHKYAGVAVDMFFDHFLAVNFQALTGEHLTDFVADFYQTIRLNIDRLPTEAARMAGYMIRQDWLTHYQTTAGIDRSLQGLAQRTLFRSGLDTVIEDFARYYEPISNHFAYFWPALVAHGQQVRASLPPDNSTT